MSGHILGRPSFYLFEGLGANSQYGRQASMLREAFSEFRLDDVRPKHIAEYLDQRDAKVAANREIALLSTIYTHAMRWGWTDTNPCDGVVRNPEKPRDRYITDEELEKLRQAASDQFRCIIDLAYLTAMRRGDILRLTLADVHPDGLHVVHQKTKKRLVYEQTPRLTALIDQIRRLRRRVRTLFLFATRDGQPYSESGFESIWRRLVGRAGLVDVHFHDIRAKALTDAKRHGGLDYAQALGGHESRDTTEGYVKAREVERVRPLDKEL